MLERVVKMLIMENACFKVRINEESGLIDELLDKRDIENHNLVNNDLGFGAISYTLKTDDVAKEKKVWFTPHYFRLGKYNTCFAQPNEVTCKSEQPKAKIRYQLAHDALEIDLENEDISVSQFGISLPFSFSGKKGENWEGLFLPSTPYVSEDESYIYHYLTRPDKKDLLIICQNEIDGWRINYSDYSWAHFIVGLELLSSFDKAYKEDNRKNKSVKIKIIPVDNYEQAHTIISATYNVPVLTYNISSGKIGQPLSIKINGNCDEIAVKSPSGKIEKIKTNKETVDVILNEYGISTVVPYIKGLKGLDCKVFGYDSIMDLYKRSCDAIDLTTQYLGNDQNLCESQMWASSLLRYMMLTSHNELYKQKVINLIDVIMATNPEKYVERCTIIRETQGKIGAYNTYKSSRLQEAFSGVTILLDYYCLYREELYLEFAVTALSSLLSHYLQLSGEIRRHTDDVCTQIDADYTTVTALIIPVADIANILRENGDLRWEYFSKAAIKIADYVVKRGLYFPTEGAYSDKFGIEVEEGSMACSALTAVYANNFTRRNEKYTGFTKNVLEIHTAWTMATPDPRIFKSTLRWWETIWEADSNGPALCCGHAWTIWRAEAQFYYSLSILDSEGLIESYNSFMTNLSKIQDDGSSYSIYQYDYFAGGGISDTIQEGQLKLTKGYPVKTDSRLSRYVWVRLYNTWANFIAVIQNMVLFGYITKNNDEYELNAEFPKISQIYFDGFKGVISYYTGSKIKIITNDDYKILKGTGNSNDGLITPDFEQNVITLEF